MLGAIKKSFIYSVWQTIVKFIYQLIDLLFISITKRRQVKTFWAEKGVIYQMTVKLNQLIMSVQDKMVQAGKNSFLLAEGTWLNILCNRLDIVLLLIPFNYLFIDYIIRRVSFLQGFATIWDELALLICFAYIALRPLFKFTDYHFKWSGIDWLVLLFIIFGLGFVFFVSPQPTVAVEGYRAVFQHMLWYFIVRQLIDQKNRHIVLSSIIMMGTFLGYHALYQYIAKVPMPGNWVDSTETITSRAFSIVGSPNILGGLFVLLIPLVATLIFSHRHKAMRIIAFLATPVMVLGLLFTFARQAYLALAGAVGIYFILFYPMIVKYMIILIGAMLAALPSVAQRIYYLFTPQYFAKSAKGGRVIRYLYALEKWQEKPVLGQGLGRFGGAVATNNGLTPFYVDSYYLKTLGEMGALGALALIGLLLTVIFYIRSIIIKQSDRLNMLVVSGIFMSIVGIFLQNAVENVFEVPLMIVLFWGLVALAQTYLKEPNTM